MADQLVELLAGADIEVPKTEREAAYDRQLSKSSWQTRLMKLADVYDNFCDSRIDHECGKCVEKRS